MFIFEKFCRVKEMFSKNLNLGRFGYKGLITKDEIYMYFSIGKEWLVKRNVNGAEPSLWVESEIEDDTNLEKFRTLVGGYPKGIIQREAFKNSKYWRALYERYRQKKNKIFYCVNEGIKDYDNHSIVIRMGGRTFL